MDIEWAKDGIDGKLYPSKTFVIASGGHTETPDIKGLLKALLTTDQILDMQKVPASVLVYGADTIAVEMATLLNAFGSKVYIATDNRFVLPDEDHDSGQRLGQALSDDGIEMLHWCLLGKLPQSPVYHINWVMSLICNFRHSPRCFTDIDDCLSTGYGTITL